MEDFLGDMDFKLAGTRQGITALQVSRDVIAEQSNLFEKE